MRHVFKQPCISHAIQNEQGCTGLVFGLGPDLQSNIQRYAICIDLIDVKDLR